MPVITTSSDSSSTNAYKFTANDVTLTIIQGVSLSSENSWDAIYGNNFGAELVENSGEVSGGTAIDLTTGDNIVWNTATGTIFGLAGVSAFGSGNSISNDGAIFATGDGVSINGDFGTLFNTGAITGGTEGVSVGGANDQVVNSGRITSTSVAIVASGSALTLRNSGTIDGAVLIQDAGATIRNSGHILGGITLGTGANTFNGVGGTVDGTITGGTGVDTIHLGSDGETVDGGGGLDQIYGGTGADTFAFSHDGAANAATIHGFNVGNDTIELSHSLFTKLAIGATPTFAISKFATSASDHLFYNTTNGSLWYDSNGNAAGGAVEIANFGPGLKLTASNFTVV
jgi:Ca2+-binding RTX toxin-like protein